MQPPKVLIYKPATGILTKEAQKRLDWIKTISKAPSSFSFPTEGEIRDVWKWRDWEIMYFTGFGNTGGRGEEKREHV